MQIVFRIECGKCSNRHGPVAHGGMCEDSVFQPLNYGCSMEPPQMDTKLNDIEPDEVCGTLLDQFDRWWSGEYDFLTDSWREPKKELHSRWVIAAYDVPDEDVRIGWNQVCFKKRGATLLRVFRSVAEMESVING